jgi:hypothetical protein
MCLFRLDLGACRESDEWVSSLSSTASCEDGCEDIRQSSCENTTSSACESVSDIVAWRWSRYNLWLLLFSRGRHVGECMVDTLVVVLDAR